MEDLQRKVEKLLRDPELGSILREEYGESLDLSSLSEDDLRALSLMADLAENLGLLGGSKHEAPDLEDTDLERESPESDSTYPDRLESD